MPNNHGAPVTPNLWRDKITETLDMTNGKKRLHLASRKIDVNQDIFHLVIGLGGSGLKALLETKGLIEQTCENAGSRVAYLALDTSKGDLNNFKSSPETGAVCLDKQEKGLMSDDGLNRLFAPVSIVNTLNNYPELFTWADERINPPGNQSGASGTRQIARLVLTKNYRNLINSIADKIRVLTTDVVMVPDLQLYVYVVAGIAGGTGSGTFMDIPYLVRDAVHQAGFHNRTQVFGYIFTPDVNFGNGANEDMLKRNGYAALQELDYNLQIPDMGETMNIHYPGKTYVAGGAGDRFFDKIHMLSSKTDNGISISNPLAHGSRVVAQNILSFVANEQVVAGNAFTVSDYYSNIDRIADALIGGIADPHRFHKYIAIGSAEFELPIDDIMMYVATLLFEKMDAMISAKPDVADINEEERVLQLDMDGLFDSLKVQVPFAANTPQAMSFDALVDDRNYWLNQSLTAYNNIRVQAANVAANAVAAVVQDRTGRFSNRMGTMFVDPNKGPAFVNHVIHYSDIGDGLLDRLRAIRNELHGMWLSRTPQNCPVLAPLAENYSNLTNTMAQGLPLPGFGRGGEKANRARTINNIGSQIYAISVQLALADLLDQVCEKLYDFIQEKNEHLFDIVVTVLECMNSTFKANGDILTDGKLEVRPGNKTYTWGSLDVPVISYFVRERFDSIIGPNAQTLIQNFVRELWDKANDWVQHPNQYDPVAFVSKFIDVQFNGIAQISIENILTDLLSVPGTLGNLQSGIDQTLMPWLEGKSRPLYSPANANPGVAYPVWRLISVPANCTNVYKFVNQYCQNHYNDANANGYNLQRSNLRTRIYMQTVTCALPLSEFAIVEQFEEVYAQMRDQAIGSEGLHLVHNINSPHGRLKKTWNDLYTLIPQCTRPNVPHSPEVQKLLREEDARKQMFKDLIDAKSPMMRLEQPDGAIWSLEVDTTAPILHIEGDKLQWVKVIDKTNKKVLKEWSCNGTLQQIKAVQDELTALKAGGFGGLPNNDKKTRIINGTLITDPISGVVDVARTMDYLLEACQCRLELVYSVRAEKAKFETLDSFLNKLQETYDAEWEKQLNAEMHDFAKLLINGDLMLHTDLADSIQFFAIRGYDGVICELNLPIEADFDTPDTCFKLYQGYHMIMTSHESMDKPAQHLLNTYLDAINNEMKLGAANMDTLVKDHLLDGIDRVNAAGKLNQLRIKQGVDPELIGFYEKLNDYVKVLAKQLAGPAPFAMPDVKPVKQEAPRRKI